MEGCTGDPHGSLLTHVYNLCTVLQACSSLNYLHDDLMSPSRNPHMHQCQVQRVGRKEGERRQMRSLKDLHVFYPLQVRSTSSLPAKAHRYSRTTENSTSWWTLKGALIFEYTEQHIVYNGVYATASLFFRFHCSHVKYVMLLLSNANIETRVINSIFIPLYKTSPGMLRAMV